MIRKGTNVFKKHKDNKLSFNPEIQQINFLDNRVYRRKENLYYPSVTTILQYMPKDQFFENWLKDVGWNANKIARIAAEEGSQVHEAGEQLLLGKEISWLDDKGSAKYSAQVWEMILRFADFCKTANPEVIMLEQFVYSDEWQYAGTVDLVCTIEGKKWLLDFKTSNLLHRSYNLQLAAYAQALKETKGINVDHTGIVWLKSSKRSASKKPGIYQGKGWELKQIDNIEYNFKLFEYIYEFYRLDNPVTEPVYKKYPTVVKLGDS